MFAVKKGKMPRRNISDGVKRIEDPTIPRGYREVCTVAAWKKRRIEVCHRHAERCACCGRYCPLEQGDCHHIEDRGLGGGTRDDHMDNLQWMLRAHHRGETHIPLKVVPSKRLEDWQSGNAAVC